MKKILFSVILIASVLIFSAFTYKSNTNSLSNSFIQGISGTVTYSGNPVASLDVHISKGSYSVNTTTNGSGYYQVLGELDGEGTYTVTIGGCNGKFIYSGSNSGYFNLYQVTINVATTRQIGSCEPQQ